MWLRRPKRSLSDFGYGQNGAYGLASDPAVQETARRDAAAYEAYVNARKTDARRQFKQGAITGLAVLGGSALAGSALAGGVTPASTAAGGSAAGGVGTAPGYGSLFAGNGSFLAPATGAATGAGGTTSVVAPMAARGISSMFTGPLASTIAGGLFSMASQRSQNKAADQARRDTLTANAEALKLQREQLEAETRNANLDREELRAQNAAINELKKRELDAAEEVRAFDREQALYLRSRNETEDRRLAAQEQRREPYRQAGSAALGRLMSMWGL